MKYTRVIKEMHIVNNDFNLIKVGTCFMLEDNIYVTKTPGEVIKFEFNTIEQGGDEYFQQITAKEFYDNLHIEKISYYTNLYLKKNHLDKSQNDFLIRLLKLKYPKLYEELTVNKNYNNFNTVVVPVEEPTLISKCWTCGITYDKMGNYYNCSTPRCPNKPAY